MATTTITKDSFAATVKSDGIVLLDFWAAWCGPCRQFGPVFEQVSEQHPDVTFGKVDTEAEPELAGALGIQSIPTLIGFRDGIMVFNNAGAISAGQLEQLVEAIRGLDMEQVRHEAEQKALTVTTVEPDVFEQLAADPATTVLDVRTPAEFAQGHLPGATNLDVQSPDFATTMQALSRDGQYALYCQGGVRSAQAKQQMYAAGFPAVADLAGGFGAWQAAGKPVQH